MERIVKKMKQIMEQLDNKLLDFIGYPSEG